MLQRELADVERLVKALSRDLKSAQRDVKRERKDVANAKYPLRPWWSGIAWPNPERDDDEVAREEAELAEAEADAAIASDLAAIAQARADTLRTRIEAGETETDDTGALAYELRRMIDTADASAADAQAGAVRAILEHHEGPYDKTFLRARRELAGARVQLALLLAHLAVTRGDDDPTLATLSAIDLHATGSAPTEAWRKQIAEGRARLVEALVLLMPASVYR